MGFSVLVRSGSAGEDTRGRAGSQLLRQLVLALRVWQPEVVVADDAGEPLEAAVADLLREAFDRAADPGAYQEQINVLKLAPWKAKKLYARWDGPGTPSVVVHATEPRRRLDDSPRDFAAPASACAEVFLAKRSSVRLALILASSSAA